MVILIFTSLSVCINLLLDFFCEVKGKLVPSVGLISHGIAKMSK